MASERPKLSRAGTMQQTAEEGEEFLARYGFESYAADTSADQEPGGKDNNDDQEEQENDDTEPSPKRLKRQSTMAVTAKEGEEFLQREGYMEDSPVGTPPDPSDDDQGTPKVKRASTMEVTAKEGAEFVSRMEGAKGKTVTFKHHAPKLQRDSTIDLTIKEGEEFLKRTGGVKEDDSKEESEEDTTGTPSRPKLERDSTIDVTVKEGEEFLRRSGAFPEEEGDEECSGNDDKDDKEAGAPDRAPLKRAGTMDVTKAEGEELLKRKKT